MSKFVDIVFDGPPSHESGRFVETENDKGEGIALGEWVHREDGYWALRIPDPRPTKAKLEAAEELLAGVERIARFWNPAHGDPCGAAETLYCAARAAGLGQGGSDGE